MFGGVQAVAWADVKQMVVILAGVLAAVVVLVLGLPDGVGLSQALHVAGATGRLTTVDFHFDLTQTYTFWSGLIGGTFLALGYFGCDQSQVQRYLTAKSIDEARQSLLMSAFFKIPLQALILLTGVLVFVFYLFNQPPMLFNPVHDPAVEASGRAGEYAELKREFTGAFEARRDAADAYVEAERDGRAAAEASARRTFVSSQAALTAIRKRAAQVVMDVTGDREYNDVNYVFPTFVTTWLPMGLVGLMIAAIFAAAMSSVAAELNSLSTATVIDFYRRHFKPDATDRQTLLASKLATGFWGIFASVVAMYAVNLGALIEVVNRIGSFFYGSLFGIFLLAIAFKRTTPTGAFWGLIAGMVAVAAVGLTTDMAYLWQNVLGTVVVVSVGLALSAVTRGGREPSDPHGASVPLVVVSQVKRHRMAAGGPASLAGLRNRPPAPHPEPLSVSSADCATWAHRVPRWRRPRRERAAVSRHSVCIPRLRRRARGTSPSVAARPQRAGSSSVR